MNEPMGSQRDAASVIFNLPDYHVIDAVEVPLGGRRVIVRADDVADGCPECEVSPCLVSAAGQGRAARGSPGGDHGEAEAGLCRTRVPAVDVHPVHGRVAAAGPVHDSAADGAADRGHRSGIAKSPKSPRTTRWPGGQRNGA